MSFQVWECLNCGSERTYGLGHPELAYRSALLVCRKHCTGKTHEIIVHSELLIQRNEIGTIQKINNPIVRFVLLKKPERISRITHTLHAFKGTSIQRIP